MIPYKQLLLSDIFTDCQNKFEHNKTMLLWLIGSYIDIDIIAVWLHTYVKYQRVSQISIDG